MSTYSRLPLAVTCFGAIWSCASIEVEPSAHMLACHTKDGQFIESDRCFADHATYAAEKTKKRKENVDRIIQSRVDRFAK